MRRTDGFTSGASLSLMERMLRFIPICFTVFLILLPHPSLLIILVRYHLQVRNAPFSFVVHLFFTYTFTFLVFSSLFVCASRDPGAVPLGEDCAEPSEEVELRHALMTSETDDDDDSPGNWCFTCQAPKPERTHHCSQCGRCVLKMDHHCPWIGSKCVGLRTYPAFLHFLCSVCLLSLYVACISLSAFLYALNDPSSIDEYTPVHALFLSGYGFIFTLVVGPFFAYHIYLVSTNQTTIESGWSFILLRHLPPLPPSPTGQRLSNPPLEHELTHRQRILVRRAHGAIRVYDVGLRRNWAQVLGWGGKNSWIRILAYGGDGPDDGRSFPRNPRSDEMLARLATELVRIDSNPR